MISGTRPELQRQKTVTPPVYSLWVIVAVILAPALVFTTADPDLWGHLRFGLDTLAQHTLPSIDPYSFTQDVPWVNHEWLSELVMAVAYRSAGVVGLSLLKGALAAVLLIVVLQRYAAAAPALVAGVIVLLAAGTGRQIVTLRPQLWTLIGVALLCRLFIDGPRRWWLIAVPALFWVWVNLHGGWIVGAGLLAVWTACQMVRPDASRRFVATLAVLSALATLVNPYGVQMWAFLAGTVRMSREIAEWRPLTTVPVVARIPWIAVVSIASMLAIRGPRPRIDRLAMLALMAFGAFRVERLAPLFVVAGLVLLAPALTTRWASRLRSFDPLTPAAARGAAIGFAALVVVAAAVSARAASCISMDGDWILDRVAGRALAAARPEGRMVTYFDWGEYAIWHLGPRLRVSIDGRRETVYSDRVLAAHEAIDAATPEGTQYLQGLNPDYVWLPARFTAAREWLARHGYRIDLQTDESFVAVRKDRAVLPMPPAPSTDCFPGP